MATISCLRIEQWMKMNELLLGAAVVVLQWMLAFMVIYPAYPEQLDGT